MLAKIAKILLIIGGINWLLHAFGMNLVEMIFGSIPILVTIVYVLIGISAILELLEFFKK